MSVITVPGSVSFAGFYYPDILRELLLYFRRNRESIGLTDENEFEVHVQLLQAFALVGHLNNTRLDTVASELLLDTAKLLESVKRLMRFVGVELNSATPATVAILLKLSEVYSSDQTAFVSELAEFSTDGSPSIPFEVLEEGGVDLQRNDQVGHVFGLQEVKSGVGSVDTGSPDIFTRTSGDSFAQADADNGRHLFVPRGLQDNGGEFRVTEYISANQVRVVRVPGSTSPGFQDETGLDWSLKDFTDDYATEANTGGSYFSPLPATPVVGDAVYVGHPQVLFGQLNAVLESGGAAVDLEGVWEYFDDSLSKFTPSAVADNGDGTLTLTLTPLLGTTDRSGAEIIVEYLPTGATERLESVFAGGVNKATTASLLGQVAASTDIEDYSVTCDWVPLDNQADGSDNLEQDGALTYNFPQDEDRDWQIAEVNLEEGYFVRYRVVSVGGSPAGPSLDRLRIDQGDQYLLVTGTQGETIGPQILGSSDESPDMEFELPDTPFLDATETIEVDESGTGVWVEWTRVSNFLTSLETSRHYIRETDSEGTATIRFGDGTYGKIPPLGTDNVRGTYRIGGDDNGNVGIGEVNTNADGVNGISEVSNPRSASGWRQKDGATDADLDRIKRDGPAELRTRSTASNGADVEYLAVNDFTDTDGTKPVTRAVAFEEGLGPKTIKLMVVGAGGATLSSLQKEALEEYFNGDRYARPPTFGKLVANHRVTVFNYDPQVVPVQVTVTWPGGNPESIRNVLLNLLTPLALEDDGVTYTWDFDGYVSLSRVYSEIHAVDPAIEDVPVLKLNGIAASLKLGSTNLPTTTAGNITVNLQG
jgi:hypothetical protein